LGKVKEEKAFYLFWLLFMLPRMVNLGLISREEAGALQGVLTDELRGALGLK